MTTPIKLLYGSATAITCTLSGLADGSAQESLAIDNTTNLFIDFAIELKVVFPNTSPTGTVAVYVLPSLDGANYMGGGTGTNSSFDFSLGGNNLPSMFNISPVQNGTVRYGSSMAWNLGYVPPKFSLVVANGAGDALAAGSSLQYVGIKAQFG